MCIPVIKLDRYPLSFHLYFNLFCHPGNFIQITIPFINRYDNHLDRSQLRWQDQSVIIRVTHYQGTHHTGRNTPRSGPDIIKFPFFGSILHIKCLSEILTQEM